MIFLLFLLLIKIKKKKIITTNNFIHKEDKINNFLNIDFKSKDKENNNKTKINNLTRSKSTFFEKEIIPKKNNIRRKSIVEELKCFNSRNSDLGNKVRKKGLDMSQCKGKSDKALIDLMKYMNSLQKNLNGEVGKI